MLVGLYDNGPQWLDHGRGNRGLPAPRPFHSEDLHYILDTFFGTMLCTCLGGRSPRARLLRSCTVFGPWLGRNSG